MAVSWTLDELQELLVELSAKQYLFVRVMKRDWGEERLWLSRAIDTGIIMMIVIPRPGSYPHFYNQICFR